ncbi:MAG: putative membrane protein YqiK [Phenylobacterium sp.]|jgi:uncharacterized membrane protein YqiK
MDNATLTPILISAAVIVGIIISILLGIRMVYKKVSQGYAMIINDISDTPKVSFTGSMVLPVLHKMEIMKISLITLEIDRRAKDGLICQDNLRADITVAFYLRVNETREDVLKVAKCIGVDRASDKEAVNELFNAKFSEALKTVGKQMLFLDLFENRIGFREKIIEVIGDDLSGYVLEDVAIDYLEQTPKSQLDPNSIQDSEGIRRITEITAEQNIQTNRLEKDEELAITKKNVEAKEAMLSLERQQADAQAKQTREIESIQAREEAETAKVQHEERQRSEQARIETDESIAIREENKQRQVEIAQQNRLRALVIEQEKVQRAKEMEAVNRERDVELEQIAKEKALEEERKIIAQTVSERIAVDKKVAEEEERIKELREVSEADRQKQVKVLDAQASAEEKVIQEVKMAEADEQKAHFKAKEINLIAQAELEAASKDAEARKKRAEGQQAEEAASGLAEASVMQARAIALEKEGIAEANVMVAKAQALETQGLAEAKVQEEKLSAQAKGDEEIGMAQARVSKEKASAEAAGLVEKFAAMNDMNADAREFEEFKMNLEAHLKETMANIDANQEIAKEQSAVIAAALENANIDIVGGQGDYFDKLAKGLGGGNALNGFMEKSPVIQALLEKFLNGPAEKKIADSSDA